MSNRMCKSWKIAHLHQILAMDDIGVLGRMTENIKQITSFKLAKNLTICFALFLILS